MNVFVVAAEFSPGSRLAFAVQALGGRALTPVAWIVPWQDTADSLSLKLKPYSESRVIVCSISDDWSYR
jgi:hypothetical protein